MLVLVNRVSCRRHQISRGTSSGRRSNYKVWNEVSSSIFDLDSRRENVFEGSHQLDSKILGWKFWIEMCCGTASLASVSAGALRVWIECKHRQRLVLSRQCSHWAPYVQHDDNLFYSDNAHGEVSYRRWWEEKIHYIWAKKCDHVEDNHISQSDISRLCSHPFYVDEPNLLLPALQLSFKFFPWIQIQPSPNRTSSY